MTKARDLADFVSAGNPLADGTIDVADINGVTATTAELNYTDGVTSNIQTQLDAKLPLSGGTMTGNLNLGDSDKLQLGDSQDIQLYHDGANSYFTGGLVGTFYIRGGSGGSGGGSLAITDASGGNFFLRGTYNGATGLYWNGQSATPKIATTSTGVEVNGNISVTGTVDGRDIAADGTTLDGLPAAYQSYTDTAISNLVDTAPATLDTLNELAAALGDDANFSTTVTNSIATKVAKSGDSMTGNLTFGDNDKAVFGAGSDLQIYHSGTHSYVEDAGTGNLILRSNGNGIVMQAVTAEDSIVALANGAVNLYYDNALKLATATGGVSVTGNITVSGTVDGRDVATDGSKLDGIEAGADVTDTTNVTAAGALMDSELTNITAVKALNQGVATSDSPTFAGGSFTATVNFGDGDEARFGAGNDLRIYHTGSHSYIQDGGTGNLYIGGNELYLTNGGISETYIKCNPNASVDLYYDNSGKLSTTSYGITINGSAVASTITASISGSTDLNFDTYQNFVLTVTANATLNNPTTEKVGQSGFMVFIHSGAGRTISLGSDYETAGGAGLTLSATAGATDIVPYIVAASGRILLGTPQLAFS